MFLQEPCVISTHTTIPQPIRVSVPASDHLFHFDQFNTVAPSLPQDTAEPWQAGNELLTINKSSLNSMFLMPSSTEQDDITTFIDQSYSGKLETQFKTGNNSRSHFGKNCVETKPKQLSSKSSRKTLPPNSPEGQRRRRKANEREKQRIVVLKQALDVLKNCIPTERQKPKMTKLEILNQAREYINYLKLQLVEDNTEEQETVITTSGIEKDFVYLL